KDYPIRPHITLYWYCIGLWVVGVRVPSTSQNAACPALPCPVSCLGARVPLVWTTVRNLLGDGGQGKGPWPPPTRGTYRSIIHAARSLARSRDTNDNDDRPLIHHSHETTTLTKLAK
ncbi:unnamed protein product, partial [Ectocarpus sp. 6 AP-2014]